MTRVQVVFHAGIKALFDESEKEVALSGAPLLRTLLEHLCDSEPRRSRLFDAQGGVRQDVTLLLNGRNVLFLSGLDTLLKNGDKVAIFPPVYGG